MAVARRHGLWAVEVGSAIVGGITSHRVGTGTELVADETSGEVHNRFLGLMAQNPTAGFTTKQVSNALDQCGLLGTSLAVVSGVKFYLQKHAEGGARTSGSNHRKLTFNEGLIYPTRLSCEHQRDAELEYALAITYDGTNDPIVVTDSSALPSGIADALRFTLGPVTIESVALTHVKRFELDFGIEVRVEGADSDIWPTFASVISVKPTLRLSGIDIEWFKAANIPLLGKVATHANTKVYLRKRSQASATAYVADGTAEHVKFTAAGLAYIEEPANASGQENQDVTLVMPLKYDGTNLPLVINTASAIT